MKKSEFEKLVAEGKTVISMDYVEGDEDRCTTGAYGDIKIILEQIAKKVAYIFAQLTKYAKIDAVKNINILCDNIKFYYARFMARGGDGSVKKH